MSRRPLSLLLLALASAAGALAVWIAALGSAACARWMPVPCRRSRGSPARRWSRRSACRVLANPTWFLAGGALLTAGALLRRRWLMACAVPAILLGANATTQLLKPALADPRSLDLRGVQMIYHGTWPSGHSTASMSLALCLVLVVGPRLRPSAAVIGAGYGYALVALGYHLPSDVLGGYLVAATFTLVGTAALVALEARAPARAAREQVPSLPALAASVAVLLACVAAVLAVRAPEMTVSALQRPTAIAAGAGIALLGLALTTGLAVVLRRR